MNEKCKCSEKDEFKKGFAQQSRPMFYEILFSRQFMWSLHVTFLSRSTSGNSNVSSFFMSWLEILEIPKKCYLDRENSGKIIFYFN